MSDELSLGGPSTTSVVTTELAQESARVAQMGWEVETCLQNLVALDRLVGNGILNAVDAPLSALHAEHAIDESLAALRRARQQCDLLQQGLSCAARQYEGAEHAVSQVQQALAAHFGYLLGSIGPILIALLLPGILAASTGAVGFVVALPEKKRAELVAAVGAWLTTKSRVLTDPHVVTAVRLTVMSADDFGAGLAHVPRQIVAAFGDEGLGIFGIDTSAAVIAGGAAGLGLLKETPIRVAAKPSVKVPSNAQKVRDRLERIPHNPDQIRIDRYSSPGEPDRFEVYIAGTEDFSPVSGREPFDLTSNVAAMAGGSDGRGAASYRAVVAAMAQAGIDSRSPLTLAGYSQGALIAAQLAASGDYAIEGLVTAGGPAGQVSVPHHIAYLAVEHSDDLIPALGGTYVMSDPLVVRRQVFDGPPALSEPVMPAHRLSRYIDTAALIDESRNLNLRKTLQQFEHPHAESVTATVYQAERVQK